MSYPRHFRCLTCLQRCSRGILQPKPTEPSDGLVSFLVMTMKKYLTHSRAPELDPHYQMQFSLIQRTHLLGGKGVLCILNPVDDMLHAARHECLSHLLDIFSLCFLDHFSVLKVKSASFFLSSNSAHRSQTRFSERCVAWFLLRQKISLWLFIFLSCSSWKWVRITS